MTGEGTMTVDKAIRRLRELSPDGIVDGYVNGNPSSIDQQFWTRLDYMYGNTRVKHGASADEIVDGMDEAGVDRALLAPPPETAMPLDAGYRWTLDAVQRHPERFGLSVRVDPHAGMTAVRQLESMVRNDGARALRLAPYRVGLPPTDRVYFPLYTKCVELGIPVTTLVGLMTPQRPAMVQDPSHLDELCYLWPELTIVACHGGEAWAQMIERLVRKWPNLYYMMSAHAPRRYPRLILDLLNSRHGRRKVLFASDYPLLTFQQTVIELASVELDDDVWPHFLHHNSQHVFWNEHAPSAT